MNDTPCKEDIFQYREEFAKNSETVVRRITIYYPQKVEQASANNLEESETASQHDAVKFENYDLVMGLAIIPKNNLN